MSATLQSASLSASSVGGSTVFLVGRDTEGHWLAIDAGGRAGGLFRSRQAALRYAEFETDHRSGAVRQTDEPIALPLQAGSVRH